MNLIQTIKASVISPSTKDTVLSDVGRRLLKTINLEVVADIVLNAIRSEVHAQKATILLWDETSNSFEPAGTYGTRKFDISIPDTHPIVQSVRNSSRGVLSYQSLQGGAPTDTTKKNIVNTLQWLDSSVVVALSGDSRLNGLILIGQKQDASAYTRRDMHFLGDLAALVAKPLEHAQLYQKSVALNRHLRDAMVQAHQEAAEANMQLRNLDKAKSEFLSIASHQLYTPLTALRGYISMLQAGDFGNVPNQQTPVLVILEKSSNRLIDLIKNLLDISRIESGRLELKLESVDMAEMAHELVTDLMPNAMNKNLDLVFNASAVDPKHVVADRERLRQVMLNFIDNAIKYTSRGRIDVYVYQQGASVVFSVKDTGKGIKKEDIPQLFHKFSRVGGSARFHTEGTGLGLYVARQIVREHHGEMHVDSPGEGKGSSFSLIMPAEGTEQSLKAGEEASVVIKAAEAQTTE